MLEVSRLLQSWIAVPDDCAVAWKAGRRLSGADLRSRSAAWAEKLAAGPTTERVALFFHDSFDAAAALLGAWQARRTVLLLGDAQPDTLRRLHDQGNVIFVGDLPDALPTPPALDRVSELPALDAHHIGLVVYTSGSTGEPAAIPKSLRQLAQEVATQIELWDCFTPHSTVVSTVSHQHIYGLLFRLLLPLSTRTPFLAERVDYPEEAEAALQARPSILVSSPAFLKRLPQTASWQAAPLCAFSSGGPLFADAARHAEAVLGAGIVEIYGSSETGGIAYRRQASDETWQTLPGVQVRAHQDCLQLRSPFLPDEAWLETADRIELVGEGRFKLLGRADRLIKLEEKRVSLTAIENALKTMDEVDEAKVVPLTGARTHLGAVVVLSEHGREVLRNQGKRALNESLRERLLAFVERPALPRYWRYIDALPANSLGKTTEAALLALFESPDLKRYPTVTASRCDGSLLTLELIAQAELTWFDGHFPSAAILPGVALLQWVEHFGRGFFAVPPKFKRMDVIKFQHVIRPGSSMTLEIEWLEERSSLAFKVHSKGKPNASGRLVFGADHD